MNKGVDTSYRQIVKATSIFGGVQIFSILINIIRSKFIAVLLGPAGMGVSGLLNDSLNLVRGFTSFGLGKSAVKDVASANASGDKNRIVLIVAVLRKWVWLTGGLGFVMVFLLAPWLSKFAFNTGDYTISFMVLSVTLLLGQISVGQGVLLQGMRKVSYLAQSGIYGSILGLLTSIPLFYFFGTKGIVPSILVTTLTTLLLTWHYAKKIKIQNTLVSYKVVLDEGKSMLSLGFMLSIGSLITTATSYVVRIFISKNGGITDVGLYNAGFAIISSYVGLIFAAMATDYYPRLAGVASDNLEASKEINQQAEIALLIIAPVLCIFLVYINWAVILLYSNKFIAVNAMIHWAALGIFFKAASWSVGYLFLAKGASKAFFWNELLSNTYMLTLNILGYYYWGLTGLGISYLIAYIFHFIQMILVAWYLYGFQFRANFLRIFFIQISMGLLCFIIIKTNQGLAAYMLGSLVILASATYSTYEMNKRLGLKEAFVKIQDRFKK